MSEINCLCCHCGSKEHWGWEHDNYAKMKSDLDKSDSITAEAVSREAARWAWVEKKAREITLSSDHYKSSCLGREIQLEAQASNPNDALAQHDAEVLRPWREAVERVWPCSICLQAEVSFKQHDGTCATNGTRWAWLRALLSLRPASVPKEDNWNG